MKPVRYLRGKILLLLKPRSSLIHCIESKQVTPRILQFPFPFASYGQQRDSCRRGDLGWTWGPEGPYLECSDQAACQ